MIRTSQGRKQTKTKRHEETVMPSADSSWLGLVPWFHFHRTKRRSQLESPS